MPADQSQPQSPAGQPRPEVDRLRSLFPDGTVDVRSHRRSRRVRIGVAAMIAVALAGGGVAVISAGDADATGYRTASVAYRDVDAVLEGVASVEAVTQAAVSFPISGTVATVEVAVGDAVTTGTVLATLDTSSLSEAVHVRQASYAQAELALSTALASAETTSTASSASSNATAPSASAGASTATSTRADDTTKLAVTEAQRTVDAALAAADSAFVAADAVCSDTGSTSAPGSPTATTSTTVPTTAAPTTTTAPTTAPPTTAPPTTAPPTTEPAAPTVDLTWCRTALRDVSTAQAAVSAAQTRLSAASSAYEASLGAATIPSATAAAGGAGTGTGSTGTAGGSSNPLGAMGGASSVSTSAEGLIAAQKAVDAAALDLIVAEHAVTQAAIVAPIDGTVVAVGLAPGDDVTAASATAAVTIVGSGGYEITTTVPVDRIPDVAVGQEATVVVDGSSDELDGEVVAIAVAPDSTSSSSTYRVVIGLSTATNGTNDDRLRSGATASVAIVTDSTTSALAVPTSAISTNNDRHTVRVVDGTTANEVPVGTGVMGDTWTEITSGLDEGDHVVLADLDAALPGSATDSSGASSGTTTGGPVGFPGGGFPTGGPPAGVRRAG